MNSDNIFKLNLSLEKLSTVAAAIYFWELPAAKKKVHNFLEKYSISQNNYTDDWDRVTDYILNQVNLHFPERLLNHVKNLIQILGVKLCGWLRYVVDVIPCDMKYAEQVYWTPNGDIDELKIVQYWLTLEVELNSREHKCFLKKPSYCIAAAFAQEDFIHSHLEDMKNEILQYLLISHKKMYWDDYAVLCAWICFFRHKTKTAAVRFFRSFNTINLPASALFLMSVKRGTKSAVYYFFNKVKEDERDELVIRTASECMNSCNSYSITTYKEEKFLEILIFLIKHMDDITKLEFVTKNFVFLFLKFLYLWPYQEVCLNLLRNGPNYTPGIHDKLLKNMVENMSNTKNYRAAYFGKGSLYSEIFEALLEKNPPEVKKEIFTKENYKNLSSVKFFNCDMLSLIICDSDLVDHKNEILTITKTHLINIILQGGHYADVNKLMNLYSSEEKKPDKQNYNFLTTFLTTGNMKLVEEHLDWLYDSDSEKMTAKSQIDIELICSSLIKKSRYDLVKEYLNWQCNNEEERKKIKGKIISNGILCNQVYHVWGLHKESFSGLVEEKCIKLLEWFLESDEAVTEFRKTQLIENELFIEKYWNNLFYHRSFDCLRQFLKFCFWSSERIKQLEEKIGQNIEWWINTYGIEKNQLELVDSLMTWVFKNAEKKKVISKYMESPKGVELVLKSFKNVNPRSAILLLFNGWIYSDPSINIEKIKMNLDAFDNSVISTDVISSIKFLLDQVRKNNLITISDVARKVKNFLR